MMKFAPEGLPFFIGTALLTLLTYFMSNVWVTAIPCCLFLFMFVFFRDPDRAVPAEADAIVSPADGRIIVVKDIREEEYFKCDVLKISIFMSPLNVHVNRAPYSGRVKSVKHTPGSFYKAFLDEASLKNENIAMVLDTDKGEILVRQVAGSVARRAVCRVSPGHELKTGERYGMIKFSSRVDLYFPHNAQAGVKINVKIGDTVKAGESILAYWKSEKRKFDEESA
ncbi:MAG: phosphatidylserine decarboxylase family protein [Nitrospirae bacterium]|nr:phosphatidylserine decarboxylase family protein [Nitrospirota bacterium]